MFVSRIAYVALSVFALAFDSVKAAPGANALQARADTAEITEVLNTLKSATAAILPQIDTFVANDEATDENITPLVTELTGALTFANSSLAALGVEGGLLAKRQDQEEVANLITPIIENINTSFTALSPAWPGHGLLIDSITKLLVDLLINLEFLLPGVIATVIVLLHDVVGVVVSLLLTLVGVLI